MTQIMKEAFSVYYKWNEQTSVKSFWTKSYWMTVRFLVFKIHDFGISFWMNSFVEFYNRQNEFIGLLGESVAR